MASWSKNMLYKIVRTQQFELSPQTLIDVPGSITVSFSCVVYHSAFCTVKSCTKVNAFTYNVTESVNC